MWKTFNLNILSVIIWTLARLIHRYLSTENWLAAQTQVTNLSDTNENSTSQSNSHIEKFEKVIKELECPFTWKMNDLDNSKEDNTECNRYNTEYRLYDAEELYPLLQLMRRIMIVFEGMKSKIKSKEILQELAACDEIIVKLRQFNNPKISTDVANYVLQSTKYFVYTKLNLKENLEQVFLEIKKDWKMNSQDRGTLMACRSLCWLKYPHEVGSSEAEYLMREAIKENPDCDLWHFILGKILRRRRKDSTIATTPSNEEFSCYEKAYGMSENQVFGVFLAQMHREMGHATCAEDIYDKVLAENPTGKSILLRLALGFARLRKQHKVQECMRKLVEGCPHHSIYFHYRGIFHFTPKNYKEAEKFLKEASKDNDIPAGKQYIDCAVVLDKPLDFALFIECVENNDLPEPETPSFLHLAGTYLCNKPDLLKVLVLHCVTTGKTWFY